MAAQRLRDRVAKEIPGTDVRVIRCASSGSDYERVEAYLTYDGSDGPHILFRDAREDTPLDYRAGIRVTAFENWREHAPCPNHAHADGEAQAVQCAKEYVSRIRMRMGEQA